MKSPKAFRTISEVAKILDIPAHVLRFWEVKFAQVKPLRISGRRYYRPTDIALLNGLKKLLHKEGMSIRDAQSLLREKGQKAIAINIDKTTANTHLSASAHHQNSDLQKIPPAHQAPTDTEQKRDHLMTQNTKNKTDQQVSEGQLTMALTNSTDDSPTSDNQQENPAMQDDSKRNALDILEKGVSSPPKQENNTDTIAQAEIFSEGHSSKEKLTQIYNRAIMLHEKMMQRARS